jgi:hypothetical protein
MKYPYFWSWNVHLHRAPTCDGYAHALKYRIWINHLTLRSPAKSTYVRRTDDIPETTFQYQGRWKHVNPPKTADGLLSRYFLKLHLSIYDSAVLLLDLGRFFSFLILYTDGRTPWTVDQPVARPLPTHRTTQTQNKRAQTSMPWVGFEPSIPVFERAKTVHALGRAATVVGMLRIWESKQHMKQSVWPYSMLSIDHGTCRLRIRRARMLITNLQHSNKAVDLSNDAVSSSDYKGKVHSVLNQLSTTPWRRMGEWMYRSAFSWPRH